MDYELPEELRMMKETLRRFIDNEVIPIEREAYDGHEMVPAVREKLQARAREMGFWMLDVPEEFGGMGLGLLARVLVWEETGIFERRCVSSPVIAGDVVFATAGRGGGGAGRRG